jgi:serine/threonine protein kinase
MSPRRQRLGGCRLEKVQSRSEHSQLYRAYSEELARPVMIKVLDPRYPADSRTARRFLRGGEIALSLEHPNIVQTFAAGQEGRTVYMLMEFLAGHPLDRVLGVRKKLAHTVACDITRQIAAALEYAAARGIVHRKVEPGHIMLSPGGRVSMLGFGLARMMEPDPDAGAITADGALVGLGPYSPPEAGGGDFDSRSDLYSLGCVLYHMLTGRPPFQGKDPLELLHKHRSEPPWPARDLAPGLPRSVSELLESLLAKDPEDRPQGPAELIACLDAILKPELVGETSHPEAPRRPGETLLVTTREMMALRERQTVLVCDDQAYNVELMHEVLRRLGFTVLSTRDGRAAAEAVREKTVSLLVTDMRLPGLDGADLLEEVHRHHPGLPVVLTRGGPAAARLCRDPDHQVVGRVERPLDAGEVRRAVQEALL